MVYRYPGQGISRFGEHFSPRSPKSDQSVTTGKYCLGCISLLHRKRHATWNIARRVDVGRHVWIYGRPWRRTYLLSYYLYHVWARTGIRVLTSSAITAQIKDRLIKLAPMWHISITSPHNTAETDPSRPRSRPRPRVPRPTPQNSGLERSRDTDRGIEDHISVERSSAVLTRASVCDPPVRCGMPEHRMKVGNANLCRFAQKIGYRSNVL